MAISVSKSLKQLDAWVDELGIRSSIIPSGKNGRFMKEDYIIPIRNYFINQRYGDVDKMPNDLKLILNLKSPMLAKRIDSAKEDVQKEVWESDDWYFEEKLNGARMIIVKDSSGINIYSRHNSDMDLLPINYTNKILFPNNFDLDKIKDDFILDTELTSDKRNLNTVVGKYGVVTESQLQAVTAVLSSDMDRAHLIQNRENLRFTFNVFDCLFYNGSWIMNEPLIKRRKLALELYKNLVDAGFKIQPVRSNRSNKKMFYKKFISEGKEGCIAKNIHGLYIPDTNRKDDGWLKLKTSVTQMNDLEDEFGDTIDGWISGFEPATIGKGREGLVGNILVSTYIRKPDGSVYEHLIAKISGIDMKLREDMTDVVGGEPTLKASYYNRIVEIDGVGISPRSMRLNHAVFLGFRYDKDRDACVMDEEFMQKLVL